MLYYLAIALEDALSPLNVLTYNTVRAGGAALTAFLISLLIGPTLIRYLRMLKVGQYIRKEHVADLHALHQKKEGTPTMGGALIVLATVAALLLWARFDSRLMWVALLVFLALGFVGFLDDYIKLVRKNNKGLSARAKFAGQILVGGALGIYLLYDPITPARTHIVDSDVRDWERLAQVLRNDIHESQPELVLLPAVWEVPVKARPTSTDREQIVACLNRLILEEDLAASWRPVDTPASKEIEGLREKRANGTIDSDGRQRLNRLILESVLPNVLTPSVPDLHTKLEIPGLKEVFIPLGIGYAFFVLIVIVGSSNAVNLTDGLDGLAIGASIISLMAYTGIAYVISRADWSRYLFLVYVPEASELTVFGAALLGAGLGFLWFNSHPAEVFMGDTGSLALGGALGTLAVLTKQELLLLVVGGLFVMEAGSVILQVASFKLRGKRIFRMTPIHHHFELLGWSETKVTIRFWILAILFALMSFGALKLR